VAHRADLLVLAVPVGSMGTVAQRIAPVLNPHTVITDVGSTKERVIRELVTALPNGQPYVPGHPMAGSEHSGPHHADPDLFEGCIYVLCPLSGALDIVSRLARGLRARPVIMNASEHDRAAAYVSHLPYLVAASLALVAGDYREAEEELAQRAMLAASGFRSTSRVAAGPVPVYRDILVYNAPNVEQAASRFIATLQELRRLATGSSSSSGGEPATSASGGPGCLQQRLEEARRCRQLMVGDESLPAPAASLAEAANPPADTICVHQAGPLRGSFRVPGDKSISHRVLMLAGIAEGRTIMTNLAPGRDVRDTLRCMSALGVASEEKGGRGGPQLLIRGRGRAGLKEPQGVLWAGNSGTTARLLSGILAAQDFFSVGRECPGKVGSPPGRALLCRGDYNCGAGKVEGPHRTTVARLRP